MALNSLDSAGPLYKTIEIANQMTGFKIDDAQVTTDVNEKKMFYINFESVDPTTCVLLDFDDGVKKTFGFAEQCAQWQPDVAFDPSINLFGLLPAEIEHTY